MSPRKQSLYLAASLVTFTALWLVFPHGFVASDPWTYSRRAFAIQSAWDFGAGDVFNHRLGIILPTAAIYSVFGVGVLSTNAWPLVTCLLIIAIVWSSLPTTETKLLGAAFCIMGEALITQGTELLPDGAAGALMALSVWALVNRKEVWATRSFPTAAALSVCSLFVAFLAKESAYWVLPVWLWTAAADLRSEHRAQLWSRFYAPSAAIGCALAAVYLVFCQTVWGDALSRVRAIEVLAGQHLWSWDRVAPWELVKRLTVGPPLLFLAHYGSLPIVLAALGAIVAPPAARIWLWYTVSTIVFFWFGSTSFSRFEPMPLMYRMTLPSLPGIYILAAYGASALAVTGWQSLRVRKALSSAVVLVLLAIPWVAFVNGWRWRERPEADAMKAVVAAVSDEPGVMNTLVTGDQRSAQALPFYFGYAPPANIRFVTVPEFLQLNEPTGRVFLFTHSERAVFLRGAYGSTSFEREIQSLGITPEFDNAVVSLRRHPDAPRLQAEMRSVLSDVVFNEGSGEGSRAQALP